MVPIRLVSVKKINYLIRCNHINSIVLFEPKISEALAENVCEGFSLKNSSEVKLAVFLEFEVISVNENFIRVNVSKQSKNFQMIFVYAPPSYNRRHHFWTELTQELLLIHDDFIMGGDLNDILDISERRGKAIFIKTLAIFKNFKIGSRGTSTTTYVTKRLDQVMVNLIAQIHWPNAKQRTTVNRHRRPFHFKAAWLSHQEFARFLEASWTESSTAFPAVAQLCPKLLAWNRNCFGNIEAGKTKLFDQIDELLDENGFLLKELELMISQEETLLKQKSRELWLLYGDSNTSCFHASIVIRRRRNRVEALKNDEDRWIFD
ncbi:hypothetical protein V2J09_016740 [Rumex salicifolius]